jgi:hypothetical protein
VYTGVVTKEEMRWVEATKAVSIERHIDDYIATLTGSNMHRKKMFSPSILTVR